MFTGDSVPVLQDERTVWTDVGGCTTTRRCLMPLNWTLRNVRDGNFYVISPQLFKKRGDQEKLKGHDYQMGTSFGTQF